MAGVGMQLPCKCAMNTIKHGWLLYEGSEEYKPPLKKISLWQACETCDRLSNGLPQACSSGTYYYRKK